MPLDTRVEWEIRTLSRSGEGKVKRYGICCENEDTLVVNRTKVPYIILADGIGGIHGGKEASKITAGIMHVEFERLKRKLKKFPNIEKELPEKISQSFTYANNILCTLNQFYHNLEKCGTTLLTGFFTPSTAHIHWVGDSSALLYQDGVATPLTTSTEERSGEYLANFIGKENMTVHHTEVNIQPNDLFLFYSDGLGDTVSIDEISHLCSTTHFDRLTKELVRKAHLPDEMAKRYAEKNRRSATEGQNYLAGRDDISIALVRRVPHE